MRKGDPEGCLTQYHSAHHQGSGWESKVGALKEVSQLPTCLLDAKK